MKFTIERSILLPCIQHLSSVVSSRNITTALSNFLIEAVPEKEQIVFTATDMEMTVRVRISANVTEAGTAAVSAKSLLEIVNSLDEKPINFFVESDYLKIFCGHSNFSLLCFDHTQFPLVPQMSFDNAMSLPSAIMPQMISIGGIAILQESNRPIFSGIRWRITNEFQMMSSTDGKRIAEIKKEHSIALDEVVEHIVPTKGLYFLEKVIDEEDENGTMKVIFEDNRIIISYGNYELFTQVIQGKFPEYEKVLQVDNPNHLIIDKNLLKTAIKRVSLLSTEEYFRIKLDISETKVVVTSFNSEMGDATDEIENFEYSGPAFTIAFNYKFLMAMLNAIEKDKVELSFGQPDNGIINTQVMLYNYPDIDDFKCQLLLMPLRLK